MKRQAIATQLRLLIKAECWSLPLPGPGGLAVRKAGAPGKDARKAGRMNEDHYRNICACAASWSCMPLLTLLAAGLWHHSN